MKSKQIILAFGALLFIILIISVIQFSILSRKYDKQIAGIFTELESYNSKNIVLEDDIRIINSSSNEVRRLLSLSESRLSISGTEKSIDRKSTRLNSSHIPLSRMPSSA